ncbi:MAG: dipeptide/oligopeptide/nickel ABC transporter permease/ATP-binding protein [Sedimenticola sp.]|nr:dipeptide/oligopeptide/nickel ABC transporter permease/ATP-binding protein [Sedimenticola sp.]
MGRERDDGSRPGAWRLLLNNHLAVSGLLLLLLIGLLALAAPWLPLPDPDATAPVDRLLPPLTPGYPLGTDALGRDLLSRLVWGTRVSLAMGISATLVAALVGSLVGLVAGFAGGRSDGLLMRGIDMLMAFPYILLALAIVAVLGPGLVNALYAIALVNIPFFARNVRGVTLGLARQPFIDAARLSGQSRSRILLLEVLPNVLPVIVITISTTLGWMILETAGLSFLGLGAQPPQADLGSMLGEGRKLLFTTPHVSVIPGLMIFILVMGINLLGDGVRDLLDPRLKSGALSRPLPRTRVERAQTPTLQEEPTSLLEVRDLHTGFSIGRQRYHAVHGVDLDLASGQTLGIVGESGCGKSVAVMSITGLVASPPGSITDGAVWLQGVELLGAPLARLQALRGGAVCHVFQDPLASLHPLYRVGDQLVEAIQAHQDVTRRQAWQQAQALLAEVHIANPAQRMRAYPHQLSGGMRQRVCIAMALANRPRLIIADEPTTALDVTVQAQILGLLQRLRQQHQVSILFVSHDFSVVSALCERVLVMYAGRVVESGAIEQVISAPAHPYSALLIGCIPTPGQGPLQTIPGSPPALDRLPEGCAFAPRCPRVQERCTEGEVGMTRLGDGRSVRCLFPLQAGESP